MLRIVVHSAHRPSLIAHRSAPNAHRPPVNGHRSTPKAAATLSAVNCYLSSFLKKTAILLLQSAKNPYFCSPFAGFSTFQAGINQIFKQKNQGNAELRIDGDFYPCAF
jgi:hypothetical protein